MIRQWSQITGRRGVYKTPLKREGGGVENVLAMLKGGTTIFEEFKTQELEVLAILMGGAKGFHPLKGGHAKFYPVLREMHKKCWTHDFPIL